jgi:hypothetical protein
MILQMTMMTKFNRLFLVLILGLITFINGCAIDNAAQRTAPVAPDPIVVKASAADALMQSLRELQNMPPAALVAEKDVAREVFERDPVQFRRLRYLLALHVAPASATDDAQLLSIVEPLLNATTDDNDLSIKTMALQMQLVANSRKKLREEIASIRSRTANVAANNKRDDREPEVRVLKQRIEELEKQIAAMKSIDRSVTRR